jgi:YjbE family integral membrane protein
MDFLSELSWIAVGQIILIDILLGGDNAILIALACRNLPSALRTRGILWGTLGAIFLRLLLVSFAVALLDLPYLKLAGGVMLLWIGIKLLIEEEGSHSDIAASDQLVTAIKTIIIADLVMSIDNVIAISSIAEHAGGEHQMLLVVFGILVSIPIIISGSTFVLKLMGRFPLIIILGAALLGYLGGAMIFSDAGLMLLIAAKLSWLQFEVPGLHMHVSLPGIAGAIGVPVVAYGMKKRRARAIKKMGQQLLLKFACATNTGRVRKNNEDTVVIDPALGLALVADGMGGHHAGEVASKMAAEIIASTISEQVAANGLDSLDTAQARQKVLRQAIDRANRAIRHAAGNELAYAGMGTTVVLALFCRGQATIAHIGDSRAYRLRDDKLEHLTKDHSSVQQELDAGTLHESQVSQAKNRHWLTRAVGVVSEVEAAFNEITIKAGDRYLLCSDGLHDYLSSAAIMSLCLPEQGTPAEQCNKLIAATNCAGGKDNVTVALISAQS